VNRAPSDEEVLVRASVRQFVARDAPPDTLARLRRTGTWFDAGLYRRAAELGWFGMLVPERYGGAEAAVTVAAAAFEELGRAPLLGPLLTSGVLATAIVLEAGSESQRRAWLPAIGAGERLLALAAMDGGAGWSPGLVTARALSTADGVRLDAVKPYVHDAASADTFICAARLPGEDGERLSLFLVDRASPGVSVEALPGLPLGIGRVVIDAVTVRTDALLGPAGDGWAILERAGQRAMPILCAFMVGACREVFDFTLEYTRQRSAFGQLIGRFQRVQDHVIELANQMDAARWMTAELLASVEAGSATPAAVHEAMAVATEAYYQACNFAHMVHAGPGTDLDHPLMGHTIASRALYQILGTPDDHKRRMMDLRFPSQAATVAPR
jgi:alkylation response protein AidB-like acyl-CoA dehydrogenase